MTTSVRLYSQEDKSLARRRLQSDKVVNDYNNSVNKINDLWAFPIKVSLASPTTGKETIISDEIPSMPDSARQLIDRLKADRDKYISDNYPELCS